LRINSFYASSFIIISVLIILCLSIYKTQYTMPGLLITIAGVPVYFLWNRAKEKAALERLNGNNGDNN